MALNISFVMRLVSSSVAVANRAGGIIRSIMKTGRLGIVDKVSIKKVFLIGPQCKLLGYISAQPLTSLCMQVIVNGKNNATAVGLCAVFVVSWLRNKGLHTLNRMHNEVWDCAEI